MKHLPTSKNQDRHLNAMFNAHATTANQSIMSTDSAQQSLSLSNKRKAPAELMPNGQPLRKASVVGSFPDPSMFSQPSPQTKKVAQMGLNSPRMITTARKVIPLDSVPHKPKSTVKNRNSQTVTSPKPQTAASPKPQNESFDSVRSKLRESLAAALALVDQQCQDSSAAKGEGLHDTVSTGNKRQEPKSTDSMCRNGDASNPVPGTPAYPLHSTLSCLDNAEFGNVKTSGDIHSKDDSQGTSNTWEFVRPEFQSNPVLPGEDSSSFGEGFYIKDDLLLGNGLSWAMDLDLGAARAKDIEPIQETASMQDTGEDKLSAPISEKVAYEIESELFKLYGGVNKKYKEKGRSLLFNLKDRSNPGLRERVMSGEIAPQKLCSMTAEELASEELSRWRIAKAEELDQMKVLPDSEVNLRRLVKKTHKGEFQVDFEQDVAASVEVAASPNTGPGPERRLKQSENNAGPSSKADGKKGTNKADVRDKADAKEEKSRTVHDDGCRITIPSDGADMMQGLMVDDMGELPPILSLDEFMDSLENEPPFENLTANSEKAALALEKERSDDGAEQKLLNQTVKDPVDMKIIKTEEVNANSVKPDVHVKPASSPREPKAPALAPPKAEMTERVWEGILQLNITTMANFIGFYVSGEKAATNEWPKFFETKGRVRLDAFEKFLQELPMSKSRSVMVAHFVLAEDCTEIDKDHLQEVVDSYVVDQRLGIAEPVAGVEVYFCPRHTKILEMLNKHLPKYAEKLDTIGDGLIAIVVWRKPHLSSIISPKSSQQHKDDNAIRQQQPFSNRPSQLDMNANTNFASRSPTVSKPPPPPQGEDDDDEDDVPPGFGPVGPRDDDDLPEFNFSSATAANISPAPFPGRKTVVGQGAVDSRTPSRPADKMRELVKKYGQTGNNIGSAPSGIANIGSAPSGIALEPWVDDDDDMPEWQPHASQMQLPPSAKQPPLHIQQSLQPPVMLHQMTNLQPLQPPMTPLAKPMHPAHQNVAPWQHGAWWPAGPAGVPPSNLGSQPGQFYHGAPGLTGTQPGREWRPDGYGRSRR